jgi:acetyl esterase/lipase
MAILAASEINYVEWRRHLAALGMICIGVEFRNAAGKLGPHPFPAGLNDCYSALEYAYAEKSSLNISKIIISGESGGGNLSLATTMKAKNEGKIEMVAGCYAQCPFIAGPQAYIDRRLTSMIENNGYFLDVDMMGPLAKVYNGMKTDYMAWPSFSAVDDLTGLPPHCISVNELDPLRDEGLEHHQKLLKAGVSSYSRVVVATCHAMDCFAGPQCPEVQDSTLRDIKSFADAL